MPGRVHPTRYAIAGAVMVAAISGFVAGVPAGASSPGPASSSGATVKDGEPWIVYEGPVSEVSSVGNRLVRPNGRDDHWATPDADITHDPGSSGGGIGDGWQLHPDWSPDGQRLAFVVDTGPAPDATRDLWVSDADGSNTRRAFDCVAPCAVSESPAWSKDGRSLLYVSWDHDERGVDGSSLRLLDVESGAITTLAAITGAEYFFYPRWSPDGKSVVTEIDTYADISDTAPLVSTSIAVVDLTAKPATITKLTGPDVWAEYPDWHPDQDLIVYSARPANDPDAEKALYTVHQDGSQLSLLAKDDYGLDQPTWLPDGRGVILRRIQHEDLSTATMVTIGADGTGLADATSDGPRFGTHPRMRPLP